jgi:hypothetical protein
MWQFILEFASLVASCFVNRRDADTIQTHLPDEPVLASVMPAACGFQKAEVIGLFLE